MNIIDLIPRGKENAITRERLCEITGMHDRTVRGYIHAARENGEMIISSTGRKGYYLPTNREEVSRFIGQQKSYIKNFQRSVSRAERELKNYPTQEYFV